MRLIDADKLKIDMDCNIDFGGLDNRLMILGQIDNAQTVEERKVGKWIEEPNCWLRCSCCNSHYPHTSIYAIKGSNYCPNCGADMRGNENDC